jgi:hypothetical protein
MAQVRYDSATIGGVLVAEATAELLAALHKWEVLKDLVSEVGNIGGSWDATNFEDGNNSVFTVATGEGQAFNDQITAINTALNAGIDSTARARLMSLYQGE